MKNLCGALKNLIDYQHQKQLLQFLMGLNETFTIVRSQILSMDPLPSTSKAHALLLQEEKQREFHTIVSMAETTAFVTATLDATNTSRADVGFVSCISSLPDRFGGLNRDGVVAY